MKKQKGFTLVELIVVIAIIGVLAAILVPAMMGWVTKAKITTYNNNASEICTQLQTVLTDLDTSGNIGELENCVVVCINGNFTGTPTLSEDAVTELQKINSNLTDMKGSNWAVKIVGSEIKAVSLTGNNCRNVGGFPTQCPNNAKYMMTVGGSIENYLACAEGTTGWETKISH